MSNLDDILGGGRNKREEVIDSPKNSCIMLDPRKTQVGLRRIMFLGMVFDENGMSADQKRLHLSPIQSNLCPKYS